MSSYAKACRVCLQTRVRSRSLFKSKSDDTPAPCVKLSTLTGITVSADKDNTYPGYPEFICSICEEQLDNAFDMYLMVLESNEILEEWYKTQSIDLQTEASVSKSLSNESNSHSPLKSPTILNKCIRARRNPNDCGKLLNMPFDLRVKNRQVTKNTTPIVLKFKPNQANQDPLKVINVANPKELVKIKARVIKVQRIKSIESLKLKRCNANKSYYNKNQSKRSIDDNCEDAEGKRNDQWTDSNIIQIAEQIDNMCQEASTIEKRFRTVSPSDNDVDVKRVKTEDDENTTIIDLTPQNEFVKKEEYILPDGEDEHEMKPEPNCHEAYNESVDAFVSVRLKEEKDFTDESLPNSTFPLYQNPTDQIEGRVETISSKDDEVKPKIEIETDIQLESLVPCPFCKQEFPDNTELLNHFRDKHLNENWKK